MEMSKSPDRPDFAEQLDEMCSVYRKSRSGVKEIAAIENCESTNAIDSLNRGNQNESAACAAEMKPVSTFKTLVAQVELSFEQRNS
jgi:hypothetical protein